MQSNQQNRGVPEKEEAEIIEFWNFFFDFNDIRALEDEPQK